MNSWFKNRYVIITAIILILAIAIFAIGPMFMEGEGLITLGVTVWYLESSTRTVLRVALEDDRFLVYADNKEEYILDFLNRNRPYSRNDWEHKRTDEKEIILLKTNGEESELVEVPYKLFKGDFIIAEFPAR